jgi:hypothetical protein
MAPPPVPRRQAAVSEESAISPGITACRQGGVVAERGRGYDGVQIGSCARQGIGGAGPGQRSPSSSRRNSRCQLLPAITLGGRLAVDVEVRPCASAAEVRQAIAPIGNYFGHSAASEDQAERMCRVMPAERVYAAREGDRAVGGLGAFPPPHWPGGTGISNLRPLAGWDLCDRTRTVSGT